MNNSLDLLDIPDSKIKQLMNKGINSIEDLINFMPRKYYDFTKNVPIRNVKDSMYCSVIGKVISKSKRKNLILFKIEDEFKDKINISFFGMPFIENKIKVGYNYIFCGKISINEIYKVKSMINPIIYSQNLKEGLKIVPVYSKIKGMSTEYLFKVLYKAMTIFDKKDYLEYNLQKKYNLINTSQKVRYLHSPNSLQEVNLAFKRIKFDELFKFNMQLYKKESLGSKTSKYIMKNFDDSAKLIKQLPFDLTKGQRDTLRHIAFEMKTGKRVNSLIQADVGAGKTIIAIFLMLIACNNNYQSALMCPTTVLAEQHYNEVKERLGQLGYNIAYLIGSTKKRERNKIIKGLKDGSINMVIGTHAIISKEVEFKNLAVIVVDEEHRFGVEQREALIEKSKNETHYISMSATPIPRSLALTMYGNSVEVINIKTLPKGRKPISTLHIENENEAYELMLEEIKKGKQCYIVCPFIEDNEKIANVDSVETTFENVKKYFNGKAKVGMINGNLSKANIDEEIAKFKNKEYDIIVSTTIIEVGVNVPNATVILIKSAERFGLSQLHQLRGRVGRGEYQSYCLLQSNATTDFALEKMKIMCDTNDGFKIAIKDLELRGAGDFVGSSQTGYNKYVELMISNPSLNENIRKDVESIFNNPSRLNHYKFLNKEIENLNKK